MNGPSLLSSRLPPQRAVLVRGLCGGAWPVLMDMLVMIEHPVVAENASERACDSRVLPQLRQRDCVRQCLAAEPLGLALAKLLQYLLQAIFALASGNYNTEARPNYM